MKCGLYTSKHLPAPISRRGSESLPMLRRTCIHCFPSAGLGSPIALVQPGRPILPWTLCHIIKCKKSGNIRMCYVRLQNNMLLGSLTHSAL